jgi:hypothetical protein
VKPAQTLTRYARGRDCQIRLPGICNGDSATVVLAHYRLPGISGMGIKPPSLIGAWACFACHSVVDRDKSDAVQLAFAHGVFRTQYQLLREGLIHG